MSSVKAQRDLQCVGKMKFVKPEPVRGSILGLEASPIFTSTLLRPQEETVSAPRHAMLAMGTNLNKRLEQKDNLSEKLKSMINGEVDSNLRKKCEALAVEALSEHGADVDVIAPVEVVKQIFRAPYSIWSGVSVLIQRVGKSIILNHFDDAEEQNNRPPGCDSDFEDENKNRFLNFLIQSKRMEEEGRDGSPEEEHRSRRSGFSRVVDCQFDKFRMRLGSDPILFSDKDGGAAYSLHLSDLNQKVLPLTWLEVWLDNCMSSVPSLAIGHHEKGLVSGYEFLKTEAIFGIFGDDEPAFDPEVVHRNGLEVLKFLQSTTCKEDPGVYWLYKGAGEDVIQLFDLSTNHSSSANSMPPSSWINSCTRDLANLLYRVSHRLSLSVRPDDSTKCALFLRKCWNILKGSDHQAHEQFARLILSNKEEDSSSVTSKEEDSSSVGSFDSAPAPLISLKVAAVDHVSQAIKSLAETQHPTSEQDRNLWSLVLLLGESYLSLGEAYNEVGELHQALKNVELACSIYGSMPQDSKSEEERSFVSAISDSFPLQLNSKKFDELMVVKRANSSRVEAKPEPSSYSSFNNLSPRFLFWAKVWLLVGEIYVKFHFLQLPFSPLEMPSSEVAEEVEKLKMRLKVHAQKCASCSLVSCTCELKVNLPSGGKKIGGIFKYLKISSKVDAESNLLAAIGCFEETLGALRDLPRSCEEIHSVLKRKASLWSEIGRSRFQSKKNKEAEEAFGHAILALKESCKHVEAIKINQNLGSKRLKMAEKVYGMLDEVRTVEKFYKSALVAAKVEYMASVNFLKAAQEDISNANAEGIVIPENVKVDFFKLLGYAYVRLGTLLYKENTTANKLSAIVFAKKGLAVYKSLGEVVKQEMAAAYVVLAESHRASYNRCLVQTSLEAKDHALLATENWEKAVELFLSEKCHKDFLIFVTRRSIFRFNLPEGKNYHTLKSELSSLLQARHISNTDENLLEGEHIKDFWDQLQKVLLEMARLTKGRPDGDTLKSLYRKSLDVQKRLSDLNEMHALWTSKSS